MALQTETATLSQVVAGRNLRDMPLNGRNVYNLVALVPGVVMENGAPQIGGGTANQNATYLDGVPMNTSYFNQTAAAPSQDLLDRRIYRVELDATLQPEEAHTADPDPTGAIPEQPARGSTTQTCSSPR